MLRIAEGERANKDRNRKPDAGQHTNRADLPPIHVIRQAGNAQFRSQPGEADDAQRFANDETHQHPPGDMAAQETAGGATSELDSCVGKREQRENQERNPVIEFAGQTLRIGFRGLDQLFENA